MMHTMTPFDLDHPGRVQLDLGDHPIQPRPYPRRTVGREGHQLGLRGAQSVQVVYLREAVGILKEEVPRFTIGEAETGASQPSAESS